MIFKSPTRMKFGIPNKPLSSTIFQKGILFEHGPYKLSRASSLLVNNHFHVSNIPPTMRKGSNTYKFGSHATKIPPYVPEELTEIETHEGWKECKKSLSL
jgi:hypothetical protein